MRHVQSGGIAGGGKGDKMSAAGLNWNSDDLPFAARFLHNWIGNDWKGPKGPKKTIGGTEDC